MKTVKRIHCFLSASVFILAAMMLFSTPAYGASGYVTLSSSPDTNQLCCIGANVRISITGSYELTEDNTCTWDIYTWASWCSPVDSLENVTEGQ